MQIPNSLSQITTEWSKIEGLAHDQGPQALASYLAARYFQLLAMRFKKYAPRLDELTAHELAADVIYEFIKNDYRTTQRLDRTRGHLRGLFFRIIKARLSRLKPSITLPDLAEEHNRSGEACADIALDLDQALEQLQQQRPRLYQPFCAFYLEGESIAEIAQKLGLEPNAIKQRLYAARQWLAKCLSSYGERNDP